MMETEMTATSTNYPGEAAAQDVQPRPIQREHEWRWLRHDAAARPADSTLLHPWHGNATLDDAVVAAVVLAAVVGFYEPLR